MGHQQEAAAQTERVLGPREQCAPGAGLLRKAGGSAPTLLPPRGASAGVGEWVSWEEGLFLYSLWRPLLFVGRFAPSLLILRTCDFSSLSFFSDLLIFYNLFIVDSLNGHRDLESVCFAFAFWTFVWNASSCISIHLL